MSKNKFLIGDDFPSTTTLIKTRLILTQAPAVHIVTNRVNWRWESPGIWISRHG